MESKERHNLAHGVIAPWAKIFRRFAALVRNLWSKGIHE